MEKSYKIIGIGLLAFSAIYLGVTNLIRDDIIRGYQRKIEQQRTDVNRMSDENGKLTSENAILRERIEAICRDYPQSLEDYEKLRETYNMLYGFWESAEEGCYKMNEEIKDKNARISALEKTLQQKEEKGIALGQKQDKTTPN